MIHILDIVLVVLLLVFCGLVIPPLWNSVPWQIKHKLLGWHFVFYRDSATSFVARVVKLPNGEILMKGGWCRSHYDAIIKEDLTLDDGIGRKVIPLTW